MGLRNKGPQPDVSNGSPEPGTASAAPSTPPTVTATPAVSAAAGSSSLVAATATTTTPTPAVASGPRRDLVALRAQLAGGNGGVNPPEAAAAITPEMFEPTTRETADGGAEPLPNHPDAAKAANTSTPPTQDATDGAPAKRKRRTKAEMEAARAAGTEAPRVAPSAAPASPAPGSASPAGNDPGRGLGLAVLFDNTPPEFYRELSAAQAETEGFTILTDELGKEIVRVAVENHLRGLTLEGAIQLVRERMFPGMKTLEVAK